MQDLMFPLTKDIMFARRPGKTPPKDWPLSPPNLAEKKVKWNSEGYWEGKKDNYVWDPSHGGGMDRGNGEQGGHWDGETTKNRYREDGSPLPGNKTYDISNNTGCITGTTGGGTIALVIIGFGSLGGCLLYKNLDNDISLMWR